MQEFTERVTLMGGMMVNREHVIDSKIAPEMRPRS